MSFFSITGPRPGVCLRTGLFGSKDLLFLGLDEREDSNDFVGRTDTIIVFHLSGSGGSNALISIPRDTRVNLEGKGWNKINAAYVYGGADMTKYEIMPAYRYRCRQDYGT